MTELVCKNWTPHRHRCFYCNQVISLEELLTVDCETNHWNPETLEQIYDHLPSYDFPHEVPFIHDADVGFPTLNLCNACYRDAVKLSSRESIQKLFSLTP